MVCKFQSTTEQKKAYDELVKQILSAMDDKAPTAAKDEDDLFKEIDEVNDTYHLAYTRVTHYENESGQRVFCESLNSSTVLNTDNNGSASVKLPKIEIPRFDGKPQNWNDFKDLFKNLVNDEINISNVKKLYYLKSALTGEAAELSRDFSITDTNFQEAWALLCQRYDNQRAIIKMHLCDLFSLSRIKNENRLRKLLDEFGKII